MSLYNNFKISEFDSIISRARLNETVETKVTLDERKSTIVVISCPPRGPNVSLYLTNPSSDLYIHRSFGRLTMDGTMSNVGITEAHVVFVNFVDAAQNVAVETVSSSCVLPMPVPRLQTGINFERRYYSFSRCTPRCGVAVDLNRPMRPYLILISISQDRLSTSLRINDFQMNSAKIFPGSKDI